MIPSEASTRQGILFLNSCRHGIRNFRIRVLLYGISVPIGYEFSAKHFQNFFFGAQLVFSFSIDVIIRRCYNLVIKREKHAASWWLFWILLFCLVFFDNEAFKLTTTTLVFIRKQQEICNETQQVSRSTQYNDCQKIF